MELAPTVLLRPRRINSRQAGGNDLARLGGDVDQEIVDFLQVRRV